MTGSIVVARSGKPLEVEQNIPYGTPSTLMCIKIKLDH